MAEILDKMVTADAIVLATPVYFYTMDGQMKTFIDRTVPRYTEITDKDFYFIMTAADTEKGNLTRTMEAFRGFTEDCLAGAREAGIIYGIGSWKVGEIKEMCIRDSPTTASLATKPATRATEACQKPKPSGLKMGAMALPIEASILLPVCSGDSMFR